MGHACSRTTQSRTLNGRRWRVRRASCVGRGRAFIALLASLSLVLASCGAASPGPVAQDAAQSQASAAPPACLTDPDRAPDQPLVVWHSFESIYLSAFEPLVREWESASGRRIELVAFSSTDAILEAYRATPPAERPDLMAGGPLSVTVMADSGQFVPASACAELTGSSLEGQLVPAIATTWWSAGQQWAVPFAVSVPLLYIRAAALERVGADVPTTPDELRALATDFVAAGYRSGLGFDAGLPPVFVEQWSARVGEPLTASSGGVIEARLDSDAAIEALGWLDAMVADGLAVPVRGGEPALARELVDETNPLPMGIGSSAAIGGAKLASSIGIPAEGPPVVAELPLPGAGALAGGAAWWFPVRPAGDPAGAYGFAAWLAGPERQAAFTTRTGYVPVNRVAIDDPVLIEAWTAFPALATGWNVFARPLPERSVDGMRVGPRAELRRVIGSAFERSQAGEPVADALSNADAEFQELLDLYGRTFSSPSGA
jgi:sn-glycerol 3-phosphate transport system substrate-binding protein